ncbi:MAG: hypothetical protein E4H19_02170 [Chromatiales bacterium]|jgi:hypothetical protein|nr:MAG: hypothetical protein E4H19_02170 [Chromatiales bacterium]
MTKRNLCVVALIGAGLLAAAPLAQADATDSLLARVGKFQLDNGETKIVKRGSATKAYRVCMNEGRGAVPLKVTYEDQEVIVEPGECRLIEASKIRLASATRLSAGMTLIGSFEPGRGKSYKTDVSVAQTTPIPY